MRRKTCRALALLLMRMDLRHKYLGRCTEQSVPEALRCQNDSRL